MTTTDYAIEMAHQAYRNGFCWDEAVEMAENEFDLDSFQVEEVYDSFDK